MIKANVEINNKLWKDKIQNPKNYLNNKLKKVSNIINFFEKKNFTFTILLTNSSKIKKLNKKFRKKNEYTDALSFPFFSQNNFKSKENFFYIGDLAVSYEVINLRSKKSNFFEEFDKAWVHGLLHLVGYDHIKNKDYYKMIRVEKKILNLIN